MSTKVHEATRKYATTKAQVDNAKFQAYVGEQSEKNLDRLISGLRSTMNRLEGQLASSKTPYVESVYLYSFHYYHK